MISSIEWVPGGVADPNPKKYEMSEAEQDILRKLKEQQQKEKEEEEIKNDAPTKSEKKKKVEGDGLPADLRMDEYSDDDEENGQAVGNILVDPSNLEDEEMAALEAEEQGEEDADGTEQTGENQQPSNDDDSSDDDDEGDDDHDELADVPDTREYTPLSIEGLEAMGFGEDAFMGDPSKALDYEDESEADDVKITPDDAMVVVAKTEEDFATLEIHVYDQKTGGLYVHHDIPLPSLPLCLAHGQMTRDGTTSGNFCAVGTFDPGIEIWNLDVINPLEPSCMLGGEDTTLADEMMRQSMLHGSGRKVRRHIRGERRQLRPGSHEAAVMGLSWNKVHRHVIASGSADHTVKIWDVSQAGNSEKAIAGTFTHHRDKVQSVVWHPVEATILATGSYDRTVALMDARDGAANSIKKVKIPADCEALCWDPFHSEYLTAACEDGTIVCWDVRNFSNKSPLWSFAVSEYGGVSDISYNSHVPGMLASCSIDKTVALWDTYSQNNAPQENSIPRACGSKDMKVGKLYTVSFYPSSPWLLGCAGSDNQLALWDMSSEDTLQARFASRLVGGEHEVKVTDGKGGDFEAVMETAEDERAKSSSKKKNKGKAKKRVAKRGR